MGFNSRLLATCGLAMRREPSRNVVLKAESFQARERAPITRLRAREACFALVTWCCWRSLKPQMKADFDSWRVAKARLDFCAETFPNVVSRRPRVLHSRLAHPAATKIPSKAQSKRAQRPQAAQFPHLLGSYGAPGPVKASVSVVSGVKLTGFNEFIARKMS